MLASRHCLGIVLAHRAPSALMMGIGFASTHPTMEPLSNRNQTMKLSQLPMGGRFQYEGKVFVKTGPLTASSGKGGQTMIPRSAILTPLDMPPVQESKGSQTRKVTEATLLAAFEEFYGTCTRLADEAGKLELATARQKFLMRVK